MRDGRDEDIRMFEERLADLERRQTAEFGDEVAAMRRELDALKAVRARDGGVVPRNGGTVPVDNGLTRDAGPADEPSSGEAYEGRPRPGGPNRGFREPLGGTRRASGIHGGGAVRLSEMTVGRYVVGMLAALLVLMAACVGIGSFWWMLPEAAKFAIVFGGGCVLAAVGEYMVIGRGMRLNGFLQALAGCGFMVSFAGIAAGMAAWGLYGPIAAGLLYVVWFVACYLCAGANRSRLFYLLAYLGGYVSFLFGAELLSGAGAVSDALLCVMPATVVLIGLADAHRSGDPFLWFLNAAFTGAVSTWMLWDLSWYGKADIVAAACVAMAGLCLFCSQQLFLAEGSGMFAARTASSFLTAWLVSSACIRALGPAAGGCVCIALVLLAFVLGGMQPSLALGSMPVTAIRLASVSFGVPVFGLVVPSVVSVVAFGSEYGRRGKAENAAVCGFCALSMYSVILQCGYFQDLAPWMCFVCMLAAAVAFAVGYAARFDIGAGRRTGLFLICACAYLMFYYTGVDRLPDWVQVAALAGWAACVAAHCAALPGAARGTKPDGVYAAFGVLGLCWTMAVPVAGLGVPGDALRAAVLLGVPAFVMSAVIRRGARGLPVQTAFLWCEAGAWAAAAVPDYGVPVQAIGLLLACVSAAAIWAGFRYRRKDIRVVGLALTVTHVLAIAGATAVGSGTAGIVLSLLGGGIVCFAVSFAYNRASAAHGGDSDDEDGGHEGRA